MKDRRDASIIKNNNAFKRMGTGKGNWGTELDAQMMVEEVKLDIEIETDIGPDIFALTSADLEPAKGDVSDAKADTTAAGGDKPKEVEVRRNRKGYQILEIERSFEIRASQKLLEASKENQAPAVEGEQTKVATKDAAPAKTEEAKKATEDAPPAKEKEAEAETKVSVKTPDTKELQKAAALRFKKKGPAWGIVRTETAKNPKLSPIKEELEQRGQSKGK